MDQVWRSTSLRFPRIGMLMITTTTDMIEALKRPRILEIECSTHLIYQA